MQQPGVGGAGVCVNPALAAGAACLQAGHCTITSPRCKAMLCAGLQPTPQVAKAREFIRQRFTRKLDAANVPYQVRQGGRLHCQASLRRAAAVCGALLLLGGLVRGTSAP